IPGFNPTNAISNTRLFAIYIGLKDGKGSNFHLKNEDLTLKIAPSGFFATFSNMMNRRFWVKAVLLLLFALGIHLFSASAMRVEVYYSTGIYQTIGKILRKLFQVFPFSIGDVIYGFLFF